MAVFRRFCHIICGALFALCVVFTSQNSFADNGGSCENPYVTEGASCYTVLGASNTWDESGTNTHYLSYNSSGGYYISLPKNTAWCIETEGSGYVWDATANNGDGACVLAECPDGQIVVDNTCMNGKFAIKTTDAANTNTFQFTMSAAGTFTVNCVDGGTLTSSVNPTDVTNNNTITRGDTTAATYTCTWNDAGPHVVVFVDSTPTEYSTSTATAAIRFNISGSNPDTNAQKIASIYGSLSKVFGMVGNGDSISKQPQFTQTFYGCSRLTELPSELFNGVSGSGYNMFNFTFQDCTRLTTLPSGLFNGISGAAAHMFYGTFRGCTGLTSLPSGLFNGISGAQPNVFSQTFYNCSNLTRVPADLFAGVSGTPMSNMFYQTFYNDSSLNAFDWGNGVTTDYIPPQFFGSISETPDQSQFMTDVFKNTGIAISCPPGYTTTHDYWSTNYWNYPSATTVPGQKLSCTPAYSITFNNVVAADWPAGIVVPTTYTASSETITLPRPMDRNGYVFGGWYDNAETTGNAITQIESGSTGNKEFWAKWSFVGNFTLTTTALTSEDNTFQFKMSAAGTFTVDCGDGGILTSSVNPTDVTNNNTITRSDTNEATYTCTWTTPGAHTIRFGGAATGYSTSSAVPAIRFNMNNSYSDTNVAKIASIYGSLGAIFGTVSSPSTGQSQPIFYMTFYGASNMTGTNIDDPANPGMKYALPPNLFDGVTGAPASGMFNSTFVGCSNLTGSIPATLFSGISGAPASYMFQGTFSYCRNLTGSIPATLFSGISGAPASVMFTSTFYGCSGLTGSIPATLFSGISGAPAQYMFYRTFDGCSNLTGFTDGTNTTSYVPGTFLSGINTDTSVSDQVSSMFSSTELASTCPANTYTVTREQFNNAGKPWCTPCPNGLYSPAGATSVDQCVAAYTITYNLNDGAFPTGVVAPTTYIYSTSTSVTLPTPVRSGYTFDGWYDNSGLTGTAITQIAANSTGNKEFWAKWSFVGNFTLTTTALTSEDNTFQFKMSAAGTFTVDCGDGGILTSSVNPTDVTNNNTITRSDTNEATYTCTWTTPGAHTIRFGGAATGYSTDSYTAAIRFTINISSTDTNVKKIASIYGSLGGIFGTVANPTVGTSQPRFYSTFHGASNMTGTNIDDPNNTDPNTGLPMKYALPPTLFDGITGAPAEWMFSNTFSGCSNLTGSIPATLFSGISGAPASYMFNGTFNGCSNLTGSIPATLFSGISGAPASYMFYYTFNGCNNLTGSIPATLFCQNPENPDATNCIYGAPANYMFGHTFNGCSNLTGSIPATLFSGISGAPARDMFSSTFSGCSNLTGSIPATLFSGISGAPAYDMFGSTFSDCGNLSGSIPATLFNGISGAPAGYMFSGTFADCSNLTGSIPATLFSGISGAPAYAMFSYTFSGCSNLTGSIPATLFSGISGAPASYMFSSTFYNCSNLTGSIPATLFSGISGAPAEQMFSSTFTGCSNLTGSIPATLFNGISGAPASGMFYGTFYTCSRLTGFTDGTNTTSYVPGTFLSGINTDTSVSRQASSMFYSTGLASTCPANTYTSTREQFNDADKPWCTPCPNGTYSPAGATSVDQCVAAYTITFNLNDGAFPTGVVAPDSYPPAGNSAITLPTPVRSGYTFDGWYDNSGLTGTAVTEIPANSTGNKEFWAKWSFVGNFTLTTTSLTSEDNTFQFQMSAAGTFTVDCGDGGILTSSVNSTDVTNNNTITRSGTSDAIYTCTWTTPGAHTIRFGGTATGYNTYYEAISFNIYGSGDTNALKIASISGSLGAIFGTVENPTVGQSQPRFRFTFFEASNMTGTNIDDPNNTDPNTGLPMKYALPPTLFSGISGAPEENMFYSTFYGCSNLTGSIPATLFAGISDAPAERMFESTFQGCSGLRGSIPATLFSGISGAPASSMFFYTFQGCSGLSGSIPATLFSGISGAPADSMFEGTFSGCSNLTGFTDGTNTTSYVPGTFLSGINTDTSVEDQASSMFNGTELASTCPANTYTSTREQFNDAGKPWCTPCPNGTYSPAGATSVNQCVDSFGITFNLNSGEWPTGVVAPDNYIPGNSAITLPTPVRSGYTFDGWYDNSGLTGTAVTEIPANSTGNKEFWAKWTQCDTANGYEIVNNVCTCVSPKVVDNGVCHAACTNGTGWNGNACVACSTGQITVDGQCVNGKFAVKTTEMTANDTFKFSMSASGTFTVDCGDGGTLSGEGVSGNTITKNDTSSEQYTCTYSNAGTHVIVFDGSATEYNNGCCWAGNSPINFSTFEYYDNTPDNIASIYGSLGRIFGTIGNENSYSKQPRFYYTFSGASNMTGTNIDDPNNTDPNTGLPMKYALPPTLFDGITGAPVSGMFAYTFRGCSNLTGSIPATLFSGISGAPAGDMFEGTFNGCSGLTGSIPATLFSGISGAPARNMFSYTFYGCSGLTGSIPATLFSGISGAPAYDMFDRTFSGCSNLTGTDIDDPNNTDPNTGLPMKYALPPTLFSGISGAPASGMFESTFANCSNLTGSIPATLFSGISGAPSEWMFSSTFYDCSNLTGSIPATLFSGISGAPAQSMFSGTFANCSNLTGSIPATLFSGISGAPANSMFAFTFNGCSNLSGYIPPRLFAGISRNTTADNQMSNVFYNSGLATSCEPYGLSTYDTGFESWFDGKVSCGSGEQTTLTLYQNASANDDTINGTITVTFGAAMPTTTTPTRTDYIFLGYFDARDGGLQYYNADMSSAMNWFGAETDSLYAHWHTVCVGGSSFDGNDCVCPSGEDWSEKYQTCHTSCDSGKDWDGTQCSCNTNSCCAEEHDWNWDYIWNGTECTTEKDDTYCELQYGEGYIWDAERGTCRKDCPEPQTTYGAIHVELGDMNGQCTATFVFSGEPDFLAMVGEDVSNLPADYDPTSSLNAGVLENVIYCLYNETTHAYDKCGAEQIICKRGYYTAQLPTVPANIESEEDLFASPISNFQNLCVAAQAGHYTTMYDRIQTMLDEETSEIMESIEELESEIAELEENGGDESELEEKRSQLEELQNQLNAMSSEFAIYGMVGSFVMLYPNSSTGAYEYQYFNLLESEPETLADQYATCPVAYPNSDSASWTQTQCYTSCTTANVANSSAVTGRDYYGNGRDTCAPTSCETGYQVQAGTDNPDLEAIIGTSGGSSNAFVDYTGTYHDGMNPFTEEEYNYGQAFYGISENSSFAVDYGNLGQIDGYGYCSTQTGTNNNYSWSNPTKLSSLTDDTGQTGATNCWCKLNGYTPYGQSRQSLGDAQWVFMVGGEETGGEEGCAEMCTMYCGMYLQLAIPEVLSYRSAMFGTVENTFPSCVEANTQTNYTITFNNVVAADWPAGINVPTTYTANSETITLPRPMDRSGYVFGGWYDNAETSGDAITQIESGSTGNKTFWAKWLDLYTITYHLNGGTNHTNNPSTYTIADTPLTLLAATKEGFIFGGWCTDSQLTTCDTNIIDTANVSDKELWAKWNELSNTFVVNISATDSFEFIISAACSFTVDWGDGRVESYSKLTNNTPTVYSHSYRGAAVSQPHSIVITPTVVNGYSTDLEVSTITFNSENEFVNGNARKITSVSGSLGAIFPTIDTPTVGQSQPRFLNTFMGATNMTGTIAKDFFGGVSEIDNNTVYGVHGQPTENMFKGTFYGCESLTGNINKDWFSTLDGTPTTGLFENTFRDCASLSGQIPGGLFSSIRGDIAPNTFAYTFADCSNLTPTSDIDTDNPNNNGILPYAIPANLFSTITGTPQSKMFAGTFSGCSGLYGSIPGSLFGNVAGEPAPNMFENTFAGDFALSGWLPANLFSKISGNPAEAMMTQTFMGCTRLDGYIPPTMFAGISNEHDDAATDQMLNIFYNSGIAESCTNYPQTEQYITGFESYFTSKVSCVSVIPVDIPLYWNRSANDNEIYQSISARAGLYMPLKDTSEQSLTMPTNPGYTFVGYFTERNGGESYYTLHNLDEYPLPPPSVNYIYAKVYNGEFNALYAHWVPVQNVALIQNNQYGGTEQVNATIDASKGVLLPEYDNTPQHNLIPEPTRPGYTFAGYWDKNAQNPLRCGWFSYIHNNDGEVVAARLDNSGTDVKTCMLCFAENDCHPFGAEINIHGGRNSIPDIYTYPERLYHLSNGYHGYNYYYEGGEVEYRQYLWVRDRESTIWPYSPEDNVTKLYAQWSPEQHVTLYRNTPDDPTDNEIVGEIVTYPGFFVPYEYIDVTDNNGKTTQQPNPAIIPSRQGYIFMGYSLYPTGGPSFYTSHDYNSDFDGSYNIYHRGLWIYDNVTELYAQWEPAQNVQLIQNDPNDVEEVVNDTIEVYFNVAMPSKNIGDEYIQIPTRNDDYRFVEYCVAEDQILPNYTRKECFYNETDNYMLRSANLVKIEGDSIQPIGGTVDYWLYSTEDGVTKLYAKWEPKQTVQLIRNAPNDTEDIVNDTVYVYKNFYLPSKNTSEQNLTAPTLTGYRFKGYWEDKETEICPSESDPNKECNIYYYNGGFSEEFAIHTNANGGTWPHNPEDNVTKLYAHWVPNQRVNLHLNNPDDNSGSDIIAEIIVNEGFYMPDKDSSGNTLQKPIREGFVFTGFFTDPITEEGEAYCSGFKYGPNCFTGGDDLIKWTYSVEDNVTDLYAHWVPNSYVIGYVLGPGAQNDPDNPTEYTSADEDITIKEPTRPGYEFIGWCDNTNPECEPNNNSPYVIPHGGSKGDVMLYANWSPASYTVTYNCGDGARGRAPDPYVVVFNSTFTPSANTGCIKMGYNFGGWAVSGTSDKKTPDSSFVWDYNENKTFTAVWVIRACPDGYFKPDEENYPSLCYPHRLHAGDNIVYLKDYKTTTPSLNVLLDNGNCRRPENCTFYANMTTDPTYMSMNYEHYLKMMYNGTLYYVCDDTTYGDPTAAGPDATAKQTCEANENYVWTGGGCKTHQEACLANGKVWYAEACYTNMNAYCVETSGTGFVWDEDTSTCVPPDNTEPNT